jgi:hypothetical protein
MSGLIIGNRSTPGGLLGRPQARLFAEARRHASINT